MPDAARPLDLSRTVDVCVCTFRRPQVVDLLASLAKQALPDEWRLRVIVADNDETSTARDAVEQAFTVHKLDGAYIHAPARNISIARNACLEAATAAFIAFIDDDEAARPDWLAQLMTRQAATSADVVFGRVAAIYGQDAPRWAVNGDLHSTRAFFRNGAIEGGYTCNVLLRRETVGDLRFDPALGRSGGEDTVFFGALKRTGAAMAYAPDAVVEEPVAPARTRLGWLVSRAFRSGQSHSMVLRANGENRFAVIAKSVVKVAFCAVTGLASFWSAIRWRKAAIRGALHAGVLSGTLGRKPLQLY